MMTDDFLPKSGTLIRTLYEALLLLRRGERFGRTSATFWTIGFHSMGPEIVLEYEGREGGPGAPSDHYLLAATVAEALIPLTAGTPEWGWTNNRERRWTPKCSEALRELESQLLSSLAL